MQRVVIGPFWPQNSFIVMAYSDTEGSKLNEAMRVGTIDEDSTELDLLGWAQRIDAGMQGLSYLLLVELN